MNVRRGDALVVALVVCVLGLVATAPRERDVVARTVVAALPASPWASVEPRLREACLRAAGAAGVR